MATVKLTAQRGKGNFKDIVIAAGSAEAQTDTVSVNIDFTNAKRGDILLALETITNRIISGKWPIA